MREPGSRSRCPAHYSRPRVLVVRSPRARGARSGLLARYVGGHLALGGYADVDVRPWRDDAAPPPEEAAAPPADAPVKDLRAFLARRGAPTPRGAAEQAALRAACAAAAGLPRVVAWDAGVATTRGEVLGRADLRLHENRPDAALAAACDLVLVCVAGDDAAGCGAFLAKSLATREGIVPVLHLACEPGNHLPAFEAAFSDAARPLPDAAALRPLAGPVVVAGALLSWLLLALALAVGAVLSVGLRRYRSLRARAGCVPVRVLPGGRLQVLLIRSRTHPESYIFPAGGVEPGETAAQAAARETIEEAGVTGSLGRSLGEIVGDGKSRTVVYALHVDAELERWQEDWRPREWFDLGVPGSPGAKQAASRVQRALLPKPVVQETYRRLEAAAAELAKEGEQAEQRVRNAGTPPTSRDSSRRRAKKAS